MDKDRWDRLQDMFGIVTALDNEERQVFLDQLSGDDVVLRPEIDKLVEYHESSTDTRFDAPLEVNVALQLRTSTPPDPLIGDTIGPFEIVRRIGHGGFGDVYLGIRTTGFAQKVAIKVLRQDHQSSETILRRFEIERQVLADLDHEGIARLLDGGSDERGRPYFVMEYVSGETILQYCDRNHLTTEARLELFCSACDAVAHAHRYGVVHRDIKPVNMLVTSHGIPKLVDFGIAKLTDFRARREMLTLTREGLLPMTPEYASPEQIRGENVGLASDVYSLGVVLYELLTGSRPYELKTRSPHEIERTVGQLKPMRPSSTVLQSRHQTEKDTQENRDLETISRNRSTDPRRLHVYLRDLDNVVLMALRKEPERRYRSAADLGEDIRRHLQGLPVVASADSVTYRMRKLIRRHAAVFVASVAVLLSLIGMVVTLSVAWQRQRQLTLQMQGLLYAADMQHGFEALERKDFTGVQRILQRQLDRQYATEQRGIECDLLDALSRPARAMVLDGHQGPVSEVAVVPGRPWLVSVGEDRKILVWDSDSGQLITELKESQGPLHSVAVSADGQYLAVGREELRDAKTQILLFDLRTFEFMRTVHECWHVPESLAFSANGEELAIGTRYHELFLVSTKNGDVLASTCTEARYWNLAFLTDGTLLTPSIVNKHSPDQEDTIQLWDRRLNHLVHNFKAGLIDRFAVSADQRWMVASSEYLPQFALFDLQLRRLVFKRSVGPGRVYCVAFSQDNRAIAFGYEDGTVRQWFLGSGAMEVGELVGQQPVELTGDFRFQAHSGRVRSIVFTARGQLVTCGDDGKVKIWANKNPAIHRFGPAVSVDAIRASMTIHGCAILSRTGDIWLNDLVGDRAWQRIPGPYDLGVAVSPASNRLAIGRSGDMKIVNLSGRQTLQHLAHGAKTINDVAFSSDGRWLAVTGKDEGTSLWDVERGELVRTLTPPNIGLRVQFSPENKKLAWGSINEVRLYDLASGKTTHSIPVHNEVTALAWRPDCRTLATGHQNGSVALHRFSNAGYQSSILGSHENVVATLVFSPDGRSLLTGGGYAAIRLWHVDTGSSLGLLHRGTDPSSLVAGLAISSDGRKVFAVLGRQNVGECILVFDTNADR